MDHDYWTGQLSDYVDDELSVEARAAVDHHVSACDECQRVVAEVRAVVERARSLPDAVPDRDLWPAVATQLAEPPGASEARQGSARVLQMGTRRFSFTLPQLVAASLALMVLSGGMVWLARFGGERTDFPGVAAGALTPAAVPATFADAHYDDAIADLQQTLDAGRARLDAETVRVLERNLLAIDRAIEQCRSALAEDPANVYLTDHLALAKKRKLALLRRAAALADGTS